MRYLRILFEERGRATQCRVVAIYGSDVLLPKAALFRFDPCSIESLYSIDGIEVMLMNAFFDHDRSELHERAAAWD